VDELTHQSVSIELTLDEIQLLTCAMAGNFPPRLAHLRMDLLRKLARASIHPDRVETHG
jgi:hypothetical protein